MLLSHSCFWNVFLVASIPLTSEPGMCGNTLDALHCSVCMPDKTRSSLHFVEFEEESVATERNDARIVSRYTSSVCSESSSQDPPKKPC